MCCLFGAVPSKMAMLGVLAVLLLVVATSSADPNGHEKLIPASQYMTGRSSNAGLSRSRKSLQSESDIPVSLPNSYSDLGPNVRASKSYRRPSRRIGMAEEGGEESRPNAQYANHRVAKHAERNDDTRDVTSQPDISSVISNDSKNRLSERISEIQKRFPNMRNRFGSRLKPGSPVDEDEQSSGEEVEVPVRTREQFSGPNARDGSELTNTNLVIPTTDRSPAEIKRPFVVRRPLRNQHRINAPEAREEDEQPELTETGNESLSNNRPSLSNRFRQILNRRKENGEDGDVKVDFDASRVNSPQRHQPSSARSDPSNSFTGLDESRNNPPSDTRNNRAREGVRKRPDHHDGTRSLARSYNELKTTSFSTNRFEYPRKTLQEEESTEVSSDDQNKENSYAGNENRDPERKFPRRNPPEEPTPDEELPNHQEESQPPATSINKDASHTDPQEGNASLNPSISDNGRNWYPNNPNEPVEKPSLDVGHGQFERQEENSNVGEEQGILLPGNDGIYRDDLQKFTSSPREQNERARHPYYARNRNPAERPDTFDAPKRRERVGMNRDNTQNLYEIPDLSLTTHGPNRNTPEPFSQRTHPTSSPPSQPPSGGGQRPKLYRNSNVLQNHISTGYQQYNHHSSSPKQKQGHEWAFDPKWSVGDGSFVTDRTPFTSGPVVSTTEYFLMEPTKVPGSPHLVARNEFPYNFWRPANANRANEGIYPKSRQSEFSDSEPEFKEVPDYLFQVGAGPVSVPEDLVRNTYEMVTAAPSFDLMNNPFEAQNKQFNSMPDIEEMESVNALGNAHRRPQRPNRNRRPNQRHNPGRNNPFSSIRNMLNPGQETRIPGTRPSMRPNRPEGNDHSGRPNFGGNGEGSSFRLNLNPIIPNNIREPFRPHPSVLPSGRPGHRQPTSLATTLVPAHLNNSPGAIGFAHFTHQPDNSEPHGPPSGDPTNNLHQRLDNQVNSEKDQYSRDERWKTPNQESIIEEQEDQPVQAHFQQPLRQPQGANFKSHPPRFNDFRRANGGRPRFPERPHHARSPPTRNHPGNGNKFLVKEPNWVRDISQDLSMFDRQVIKPVNPHARYTTTHGPALATRSHFDVKQIDVERPEGAKTPHAINLGTPHVINLGNREGPVDPFLQNHQFQYGADPADEQERQHLVRPNQFEPQQNIEHYRVRIPRPRPQQAYTLAPRPQIPQHNQIRQEPQQQSIWSALTNFDFSFLNPFSGYNNPESEYTNDVDRVATAAAAAAAIPASVLVPGGLAVLGAGLSLFYFNFVWSPTPVVKARLVDMIMKGTHASVLTEEQQRAIGDVTKVYSALSDMSAKMSGPEQADLSAEHKESLMSQDCKNRLVCQTYHEFADLLEVTKGAATLFGGALKRLDQDLLLEYFLAADRGHHLVPSSTCAAYYPSCELPELSIRGALREIAGLPILDAIPDNSLDGVVAEDEGRSLREGLRQRKPENSLRRVGLPTSEPLASEETTEVTSEVRTTLADDGGTTSTETVTSSSSERDLTTQVVVDEKKL